MFFLFLVVAGSMLGPTAHCLVRDQVTKLFNAYSEALTVDRFVQSFDKI